jgi:hypothetical protein
MVTALAMSVLGIVSAARVQDFHVVLVGIVTRGS